MMDLSSSPYLQFDRQTWRKFRQDTPLTLTEADLLHLKGQNEPISLTEVVEIYLPLSRLLNLYVAASQKLYRVTTQFLGHPEPKVPYVIGVAGSVAVGKSTTSRVLQALLARWPDHPHVSLLTTDGFLYPNATLEKKKMMREKGFPKSYDMRALIRFLSDLKSGKPNLKVPIYSHHHYDILKNEYLIVNQPDIVILEGLNVLQTPKTTHHKASSWFVSDFFDFTIYVDADTAIIQQWFMDRFMTFREKARGDTAAFFHQFSTWTDEAAIFFATAIWKEINERNLINNILPFKNRARLILEKGEGHAVERVRLRKL